MADVQKTVEILFGTVDNSASGIQSFGKGLDSISSKAQQITGPVADITGDILKLEAGFALAGAAMLAFSYDKATTVQSALLDLQKVLGDGEGDVEQYRVKLEALSDQYGVSAADVIQSAADFKQAGFSIEEALGLVEDSLIAVKISELDAATASDLIIASLKGFGEEAENSSRYLDVLNEISNNYATNLGELATGMAEISPIARSANLSFEETAAILTPAIEVFRSGSEAGTAFKTVLLKLVDDSKPVQSALEAIGVSQRDTNGVLKSAGDILFEVMGKWDGVTESEKTFLAQQLVGIHQSSKFLAVMNKSEKVLQIHQTALNSNGSAAIELAIRMQAAEEILNRTKVAFENASVAIGRQFLPEASGAVDATGELFRAFKELVDSGGLEPLFDILRPLLQEFESDVRAMAEALPEAFAGLDWAPVVGGLEDLGASISSIFDGIDLTTPEGLEKAMQKMIDVGGTLLQVTSGIVQGFKPMIDALASAASASGDVSQETADLVGKYLGWISTLDKVLPMVGYLGTALAALGSSMAAVSFTKFISGSASATGALGSLSGIASKLPAILGKAGLAGAVGYLVYEFGKWIDINDRLVPGVDTLGTKIYELLNGADDVNSAFAEQAAVLGREEAALTEVIRLHSELKEMMYGVSEEEKKLITEGKEMNSLMDEVNQKLKDQGVRWNEGSGAIESYTREVGKSREEIEASRRESENWVEVIENGKSTFMWVGNNVPSQFKESADAAEKATKKTDDFLIKMEEIASNERIKTIEAKVELNIAELEAQKEQVIAAFDSITATIQSTGEVLGDLFGAYGQTESRWKELQFEEWIDREYKLREAAMKKQNELIDAQIEQVLAQTERMESGDPMLTIKMDGDQPEIEAFMWRILEKIRVQMAGDAASFLLGSGCSN